MIRYSLTIKSVLWINGLILGEPIAKSILDKVESNLEKIRFFFLSGIQCEPYIY